MHSVFLPRSPSVTRRRAQNRAMIPALSLANRMVEISCSGLDVDLILHMIAAGHWDLDKV